MATVPSYYGAVVRQVGQATTTTVTIEEMYSFPDIRINGRIASIEELGLWLEALTALKNKQEPNDVHAAVQRAAEMMRS